MFDTHPVKCFGNIEGYNESFTKIPEVRGSEMSHIGEVTSSPYTMKTIIGYKKEGNGILSG